MSTPKKDQQIVVRLPAEMLAELRRGCEESECGTCGEDDYPEGECPRSKRSCGHHCNCTWENDHCHWCGIEIGEDGVEVSLIERLRFNGPGSLDWDAANEIERAAKIEAAAWGVIRSANHDDETHIGCGCLSWAAAMSALAGALDD